MWGRGPCRSGREAEGNLTAAQKVKPDAGLQEVSVSLTLNTREEFQEMKMKKHHGVDTGSQEKPLVKRGFVSPVPHAVSVTSVLL